MFSRKRSKSNPPRHQPPPPSSAALAGASLAFVKNSSSNADLSASAAAAALRTHRLPPTSVGDVQTKRMVRRGSNSSLASAPGGIGRGTLHRQNSSGSLTERSFRGTSPNRPSTSSGALPTYNPPPVPAIPKDLVANSRQRASSVEAPRINPPASHGRGSSVDRGRQSGAPRSPTIAQPPRLGKIVERGDSGREDPRRSINFSYPRSPSPGSSPSPRPSQEQKGWYTSPVAANNGSTGKSELPPLGPTSGKVLQMAAVRAGQNVQNAAAKPVSKHQPAKAPAEGAHLDKGHMSGKPTGTAVQKPAQPASANTGRKLDSAPVNVASQGDNRAIAVDPNVSITEAVAQAELQRSKTVADTPKTSKLGDVMQRTASVSPARSAHFSETQELLGGTRHKPPPRSLSPAKSALKHSPSSSIRNASPITRFSSAISESDYGSDDGARASAKKKKSVRVSFDETAAGENAPPSPVAAQKTTTPSRWSVQSVEDDMSEIMKPRPALPSFGSMRGRKATEENEMPEKVTETVSSSMSNSQISEPLEASKDHALGSIVAQDFAKKGDNRTNPVPPEVTSVEGSGYQSDTDESVEGSAVARPPTPPHGSKSLARDTSGDTARPSTSDSLTAPAVSIAIQPPTPKLDEEEDPMKQQPAAVPEKTDVPETSQKTTAVPSAALTYDHTSDEDEDHLDTVLEESSSDGDSVYSDAEEDLTEIGGFASLNAIVEKEIKTPPHSPITVKTGSELFPESSPAAPSSPKAYSSDSPHAITTSAATSTPESARDDNWDQAKNYWSGLSAEKRREVEREEAMKFANVPDASPIAADARSKKKKRIVPADAPTPTAASQKPAASRQQQAPVQPPKPALKKTMRGPPEPAPAQPRQTSMRRSMRDGPAPLQTQQNAPTTMRQSMRGERAENPTMRTNVKPGGLAASRFSPTDTSAPRGALQKRHIPAAAPAAPPAQAQRPKSTVGMAASRYAPPAKAAKPSRTVMSDADDSDGSASSFRRSRPRTREGGFAKRTMRGAPAPAAPSGPPPRASRTTMRPASPDVPKSSRFSVRSLSPTGSFMRRSFRKDSVDNTPERPASRGSIFSFTKDKSKDKRPKSMVSVAPPPVARSSPRAAPKAAPAPAPARRFKSRFSDSSDEDEPRQTHFRSRFADSDDEDEVLPMPSDLTPVRGIPRRAGEEDAESTDLEDESDTERRRPASKPAVPSSKDIEKASLPTSNAQPTPGSALASGSLRQSKHAKIADDVPEPSSTLTPTREKKRGFFSFGRSKKDVPALPPLSTNSSGRAATPPARESTASPVPQSPSRSPKLQRRNTSQRINSDSWPLPAIAPASTTAAAGSTNPDDRPFSSDGLALRNGTLRNGAIATRPRLEKRFSSGNTAITAPVYSGGGAYGGAGGLGGGGEVYSDVRAGQSSVVLGRNGKKKKFPRLRGFFGLED